MEVPFVKSWWVEKNVLLAGCHPSDVDDEKAIEKLQRLLDVGVRVFLSLQEPGERSPSGPFAPYAATVKDLAGKMDVECLNNSAGTILIWFHNLRRKRQNSCRWL